MWEQSGSVRGGDLEAVVNPSLMALPKTAIRNRGANVVASPRLQELYALFHGQSEIPLSVLRELMLARPSSRLRQIKSCA